MDFKYNQPNANLKEKGKVSLIDAKPAHKIQNFRTFNKNVQVLNSFAIASGYAGRDPQGGFCDRSVYVFVLKSLWNLNESSSLFLS